MQCHTGRFYNIHAGPIVTASLLEAQIDTKGPDETLTKETRDRIFGAIRTTVWGESALPDPAMDLLECHPWSW